MSDPIADMLTRVRNACAAKLADVSMPGSKMKVAVAAALQDAGYIESYDVQELEGTRTELTLKLKYKGKRNASVIEGITRISKPSRRVYAASTDIPRVLGGLGVAILSTSSGIMTGQAARKQNIGGEVLCYVW